MISINANSVRVGDEFETLADVNRIFAAHPDVMRLQIERRAPGHYFLTVMDAERPNDLRKIAKLGGGDYEIHRNRGYESIGGYHVPSDTFKYVFYRLEPGV